MTVAATVLYPAMEVHKAGCADIQRSLRRGMTTRKQQVEDSETFEAATPVDLIIAIDTDHADMFGEEPYADEYGSHPWLIADGGVSLAPCIATLSSYTDEAVAKVKASR